MTTLTDRAVADGRAGEPSARRRWRNWPGWAAHATAIWTAGYAALGVHWALGGAGFPFGAGYDRGAHLTLLAGARPETAGPVIAAVGLLGAAAAIAMGCRVGRDWLRSVLLAFAWLLAAWLALLIPDFRILVIVAYAPILLLGAPFGWPPGVRLSDALPWPLVNQLVCMIGGVLWALTATAYQRARRGACPQCGRMDTNVAWTMPNAARRWGKPAVVVAVLVPVVYAVTRWAWALGLPLGISERFYREGVETGLWWRGAALATLALVGAALTLGLSQRWGEIFPRWVPLLAGKRVPAMLAILPAASVAVIATTAGLMFVRVALRGDFRLGEHAVTFSQNWAALWPELLWPIWGIALGVATLAYYYRTRGRCSRCGRL